MTTKTIEKVTHSVTPKGLPLYVKWTGGRELLRNSRSKAGKEGWEPATTLGTRVVFDSSYEEHAVYVYINEKRYYPADYHCETKSEALEMAKSLREFNSFGVKPKPKARKASPKGKKKTATKAKSSPKGKKVAGSASVGASSDRKGEDWYPPKSPKVTKPTAKKATSSPKGKRRNSKVTKTTVFTDTEGVVWQPVARRARHQNGRQPTLTGLTFTIGADNQVTFK